MHRSIQFLVVAWIAAAGAFVAPRRQLQLLTLRSSPEDVPSQARAFAASVKENVAVGDSTERLAYVGAQALLLVLLAVGDVPVVGGLAQAVAGPGCLVGGLALIGLGVVELGPANLTPFVTPTAANELKTGGVYASTRHPLYAGVLLAAGGLAVTTESFQRVLVTVALYALLDAKAALEERLLEEKHPGYGAYAAATPRFLPRVPGL